MGALLDRRIYRRLLGTVPQALFILPDAKYVPSGTPSIHVGLILSEDLRSEEHVDAERLGVLLSTAISRSGKDVALVHVDILFDPLWQVDVIRTVLAAGRNKRVFLLWPGSIIGSKLYYSEPGLADYAAYELEEYIDTYIVMK